MEIFTACSFQDLTGQRTTKVINVLRYIEQRIGSMIAIWGEDKMPRERPAVRIRWTTVPTPTSSTAHR